MSTPARHVDHLVVPVIDLDVAAGKFEAAGYIVTPRADHPFGTSNRLVVFADTYLELVAVSDPTAIPRAGFAAEVAAYVSQGEGVSHVVVSSEDAAADFDALSHLGLTPADSFRFERPAPIADGTTAVASFSLVLTPSTSTLGAFLCAHHTRSAVWHPSHLAHPNGARRIRKIELTGRAPELFGEIRVDGVRFGQVEDGVEIDGAAPPVQIGTLAVSALAAG